MDKLDYPDPNESTGRPLALDPDADSGDPGLPAFLARPSRASVYHGFPVLDDVEIDGFKLGKISDWEVEPLQDGDAFVVAPDGSRCGLVWTISETPTMREVLPAEDNRWGVWGVGFPHEMSSRENARRNLRAVLPHLKRIWLDWSRSR